MTTYQLACEARRTLRNPELLGSFPSCVFVSEDIDVLLDVRPSFFGDLVHQPAIFVAPQRRHRVSAALRQINVHFFEKRMSIHGRFPLLRHAV